MHHCPDGAARHLCSVVLCVSGYMGNKSKITKKILPTSGWLTMPHLIPKERVNPPSVGAFAFIHQASFCFTEKADKHDSYLNAVRLTYSLHQSESFHRLKCLQMRLCDRLSLVALPATHRRKPCWPRCGTHAEPPDEPLPKGLSHRTWCQQEHPKEDIGVAVRNLYHHGSLEKMEKKSISSLLAFAQ